MTSLGNIALSLKDRVYALKSDYNGLFFTLLLLLWLKKLLASCPAVDLAVLLFIRCRREEFGQFLDTERPLCVYEVLLECPVICLSLSHCSYREYWHSLACTCFVDPLSLGRLLGYEGSGMFATGGAETGLGWFCSWLATCFSMAIRCCWSLKSSI